MYYHCGLFENLDTYWCVLWKMPAMIWIETSKIKQKRQQFVQSNLEKNGRKLCSYFLWIDSHFKCACKMNCQYSVLHVSSWSYHDMILFYCFTVVNLAGKSFLKGCPALGMFILQMMWKSCCYFFLFFFYSHLFVQYIVYDVVVWLLLKLFVISLLNYSVCLWWIWGALKSKTWACRVYFSHAPYFSFTEPLFRVDDIKIKL